MHDELDNGHEDEGEGDEAMEMGLAMETASQVVLEVRAQNVELLKLAAQVAGFAGSHGSLKPSELRQAINSIWEVYSQFYQWIDPEEQAEADDEGEEE